MDEHPPAGPGAGPSRKRKLLFFLLLTGGPILLAITAAEWWVRSQVYGKYWMKVSSIPGLIYEGPDNIRPFNSLGFRGPEYASARPPGVCRVLVLGDSVAWGAGLDDDDAIFVRQFENLLNQGGVRVQVFNAAVPGYNLEQIRANYLHKAGSWPHDVVLYAAFSNDVGPPDGMVGPVNGQQQVFAMMPNSFDVWSPPIPRWLDDPLSRHSRIWLYLRTAWYVREGLPLIQSNHVYYQSWFLEVTRNLFHRLAADIRSRGAGFLATALPLHATGLGLEECDRRPVYGATGACTYSLERVAIFSLWARQTAAPWMDLSAVYQEKAPTDFRISRLPEDWAHPNAAGHRLVAEKLVQRWREQNLNRFCPPAK